MVWLMVPFEGSLRDRSLRWLLTSKSRGRARSARAQLTLAFLQSRLPAQETRPPIFTVGFPYQLSLLKIIP